MDLKQYFLFFKSSLPNIEDWEQNAIFKIIIEKIFDSKYKDVLIKNPFFSKNELDYLAIIIQRLKDSEPIQYILADAFFYNTSFYVTSDVLIPRPETEELVHLILAENKMDNLRVLDIGTGSGCIPVSLKIERKTWDIDAIDISKKALFIAHENAFYNNVSINTIEGNILDKNWRKLNTIKYDIIVSNPPYIPNREKTLMHDNVLNNEPHLALFVEDDKPLIFYEAIADFALQNLVVGGKVYVEINEFYGQETKLCFEKKGFRKVTLLKDMEGKERMIKASID